MLKYSDKDRVQQNNPLFFQQDTETRIQKKST